MTTEDSQPTDPTDPLSAYHQAMQELIGKQTHHDRGPLRPEVLAKYAITIGETNPIYFDADAARAAGYADIVATPNFLSSMFDWSTGPPESELNPDGTPSAGYQHPARARLRGMGGGEELEILAPVIAGTHIIEDEEVIDAVIKEGRSGRNLFVTTQHTFRSQEGETLNVNRRTAIFRPPVEES